jgi:anti-sigma B factor antagonist
MNAQPPTSDTLVIKIDKALDFRNAANFKTLCLEYVRAGKRNFVLDFSETGILDSTGLGSVFALYRQVSKMDGHVLFAAPSRPVEVVVQLTRTHKVFPQYPSVQAALDAVQHAGGKPGMASEAVFPHSAVN